MSMTLQEIRELLQCEVLTGEDSLQVDVTQVVASDGMSEILAFARSKGPTSASLTTP